MTKDVAVFHKFILEYSNFNNTIFYFVEGDDFCYYNPRVKKIINDKDIRHYKCGGKEQVLGVNRLIKNNKVNLSNDNKILYFVDRDYGINNEEISDDIYITDLYSIENYYLNENTIKKILMDFFEIDINTKNYNLAMHYYEECYKKYSLFAKYLNAFIYSIRIYEKENHLQRTRLDTKLSKFLIKEDLINYEYKKIDFNLFKEVFSIDFQIEEEHYIENSRFFSISNHFNFRGKYELEFLKSFLYLIKTNITSGTNGFEKSNICKTDFKCETMKLFSDYAYTSNSLIDYLKG